MIWLITCEHYSNGVPLKYAPHFLKALGVLESHRGYDVRVAPLFIRLEPLFDQSFHFRYSRLLIEPNRSIDHKDLYSPFTATLSGEEKAELLSKYYMPYRKSVEEFIETYLDQEVIHISIHSFTPNLGNQNRETPLGLLFNSKSTAERGLAEVWKKCLKDRSPDLGVRYNYPYRGHSDRFTSYLRKVFPENYYGFELEVRNDVILDLRTVINDSIANFRGIIG